MQKNHDSLTFDRYTRLFTYTITLVPYCLKVPSIWYLFSINEHKRNKPERTTTLNSFIIKKLRNA